MVDLSSCYFCGAAMDVSLRESPIVPEALAPTKTQQTTVVLCGTCERKLGRVLDPVVAAAQADARENAGIVHENPDADDRTSAEPDRDVDANAGSDATTGTDRASGSDDAVVPPSILDDSNDATNDDAANNAASDDGETPFEVDETTSVFDDTTNEPGQNSVFGDASTTIPDAEPDDDENEPTNATSENRTRDDATDQSTEHAPPTSTSNATDRSANDHSDTTPDVDPRTYNKVVRLLKNRDLPVARDEIETIAGSAYDIPDHECEAIIDAAVDRGLVAEANGQLTHPDGV
ncbi:hypothetical protein G9C85_07055 [Halorubellus sp. JP-L1]|uniref:hypothetical protein n=1 Tax=Halorubellus sp. JP-L1 TaxID=2715753 RepID=UPI00140A4537|nr:hypothetical protein [Halorubellus sp. JP-L1]NHN41394.1 hypothetical protein [Halorubellus sp. JP-L1]